MKRARSQVFLAPTILASFLFINACRTNDDRATPDSHTSGIIGDTITRLQQGQLTELDKMYGKAVPPAYDKAWEYKDEIGFKKHDPSHTFENPKRKLNSEIVELVNAKPNQPWGTIPDPDEKLIWVILEDATLVVGKEVIMGYPDSKTKWYVPVKKDGTSASGEKLNFREPPDPKTGAEGSKTRLGHPSLTVGKKCRIAGELVWLPNPQFPEDKTKVTGPYINNESGRCSIHHDRDEDALLNAASLFAANGLQVKTNYRGVIRFGNALPDWLKEIVKGRGK